MILEKIAKLDRPKRISAAVAVTVLVACICYRGITGDSVGELKQARAKYTSSQAEYNGAEERRAGLSSLQKELRDIRKQLREQARKCFTGQQASRFFENINTLALGYNLKPISQTICEPKKLVLDNESEQQKQCIETQSANVTVAGSYFDIVDFMSKLTDRSQKICITDVHLTLPPGEKVNPKASFSISVPIQAFDTPSQETDVSKRDEAMNTSVAVSAEPNRGILAVRPMDVRNPMQFGSATTSQDESSGLVVRGILYSDDKPSAVVGSHIVYEGDEVFGATVVKINEDSVEFEMDGKRWTLKVQH